MSKLSFRARALDAGKPMPIFMAEELPDLPDYSAINRAVPQMPSGMEKEEECEHHLQRAICTGLIIPTPEVSNMPEADIHDKLYPSDYKCPRQLIHMQPFTMEQDIPDYDMDSEDERWLESQAKRLDLSPLKFEEMMDRLEKSSGQTVVTLNEAKALLKEDDDLIIAVFDYWLNKRLKLQHPLILSVRTEQRAGTAVNNPYLAFRRRTEKMQTRKNRKNDETSYEKMLKLRRDLSRAVTLLELVKRREKIKREYVHLTVEIFEKRYQAKDFNGAILSELSALKTTRHAFTPIVHNHYSNQSSWSNNKTSIIKDEHIPRKEKRPYKKRKHKSMSSHNRVPGGIGGSGGGSTMDNLGALSSDEEPMSQPSPEEPEEVEDEGLFTFRRNKLCSYHMPTSKLGNWPWVSKEENGLADKRFRFTLASLSNPKRCIGFARRRMGRGGRVILDRVSTDYDDYWRKLDYTIFDSYTNARLNVIKKCEEEQQQQQDEASNKEEEVNKRLKMGNGHVIIKVEDEDASDVVKCEELKVTMTNNVGERDKDGNCSSAVVDRDRSSSNNIHIRTSITSEAVAVSNSEKCFSVKTEPMDVHEDNENNRLQPSAENNVDEMLEILREVQRDWLHFRPKTPPPGYEPPCHLLPAEDATFLPSADTPFSLELRPLENSSSGLLIDSSSFMASSFLMDENDESDFAVGSVMDEVVEEEEVPVTDTRQKHDLLKLNVNVGLDTLVHTTSTDQQQQNSSSSLLPLLHLSNCNSIGLEEEEEERRQRLRRDKVGCSTFNVTDLSSAVTKAATSPKAAHKEQDNFSLNIDDFKLKTAAEPPQLICASSAVATTAANGLLEVAGNVSQSQLKMKASSVQLQQHKLNHKLHPYAYAGRVMKEAPEHISISNKSGGGLYNSSAHTVTLNSHSANILQIPLTNAEAAKMSEAAADTNSTSPPPPTASKNSTTKAMVRKPNLAMEVT